jgi:CDP-paratose 2-epimerase
MSVALVTGSLGLIGAEACRKWAGQGFDVVGIDNDMRAEFFGQSASTSSTRQKLEAGLPRYRHHAIDIRDGQAVHQIFAKFGSAISLVLHAAAQPSHDWSAREPLVDFGVNALGTLNILEAARAHCPDTVFIFMSTNKVYGDTPNRLPLIELPTRWEIQPGHPCEAGIDETMSIDQSKHSIFGAGKLAADILVQEYGRYFGMKTACFRSGCVTGPGHAAAELHGFLAYLMKCTVSGEPYRVFGYGGKQVRDNIHACDLVSAFWEFFKAPRSGEVYNIGGGRNSNCSMLEAIACCEKLSERKLQWSYVDENRIGDHIWYISDTRRFESHYPAWKPHYGFPEIMQELHAACSRPPL